VIKICTAGGECAVCPWIETVEGMIETLRRLKEEGQEFVCCHSEETAKQKCLRISEVASIEDVPRLEDEDEDDDRDPIFGNPEVVIITGGWKVQRQQRRRRYWAEPVSHEDEKEKP
jgi:hypothetical protein